MKKNLTIILFLLSINVIGQTATTTVYTTDTGEKYHTSSCRYLTKSKHSTTIAKAKISGYTACKVCKPGGTTVNKPNKQSSSDGRCTATTQKGTRCKRNAASGSSRCWQH